MSIEKIAIPNGMVDAAIKEGHGWSDRNNSITHGLEAALLWLSENPILPDMKTLNQMFDKLDDRSGGTYIPAYLEEWQRRMFLSPTSDTPEIDDLLSGVL